MEIGDYWKILKQRWLFIVLAGLVGAVLGGAITIINSQGSTPGSASVYADVAALSETGQQKFQRAVANAAGYKVTTALEITNADNQLTGADYRQLITSAAVLEKAAEQSGADLDQLTDTIMVAPGADQAVVTFTVVEDSEPAALATAQAVVDAFGDAVRTGASSTVSQRVLISTRSPNPDIVTDAAYTLSRMPTYAALATSPALLQSVASATGLPINDAPVLITVEPEPDTTVLDIRVSGSAESTVKADVLNALTRELQRAISDIERTPVTFTELGSLSGALDSTVSRVGIDIQPPTIYLGGNQSDDVRSRLEVLTSLVATDPTIVVTGAGSDPVLVSTVSTTTPGVALDISAAPPAADAESAIASDHVLRISASAPSAPDAQLELQRVISELEATGAFVAVAAPTSLDAAATESPGTSRLPTNIVLGLLLGLAAGVAYVLWSRLRDGTISTARGFLDAVGTSPLGIIAQATTPEPIESGGVGFAALRSNVIFGLKDATSIAIVSPTPETGTHTVGTGLARSLAKVGQRVVLIDAYPTSDTYPTSEHPVRSDQPGLFHVLSQDVSVLEALTKDDDLNLWFLGVGAANTPGAELSLLQRFRAMLTELATTHDRIIVLCPPVTLDATTADIAPQCDSTLLVVRAGVTTATQVEISARILFQTSTSIDGVIANGVPVGELSEWNRLLPPAEHAGPPSSVGSSKSVAEGR